MSAYAYVTRPDIGNCPPPRPIMGWSQKLDFWHPALPEVLVYRREPQAGGHICAKVKESAPRFRPIFELSFALLLSLLPVSAHAVEPTCRVNVATCKAAKCAYLPGIGPGKGAAIEAAHPKTEAELDAVPGIGGKTLEKLRPFVAYEGETTCTSKQVAPKASPAPHHAIAEREVAP